MMARSREKSLGRLERSVEMMTHRPVIGSFLSSGTSSILSHSERVLEEHQVQLPSGLQIDADHVKAEDRTARNLAQELPRHIRKVAPFVEIHGGLRGQELA